MMIIIIASNFAHRLKRACTTTIFIYVDVRLNQFNSSRLWRLVLRQDNLLFSRIVSFHSKIRAKCLTSHAISCFPDFDWRGVTEVSNGTFDHACSKTSGPKEENERDTSEWVRNHSKFLRVWIPVLKQSFYGRKMYCVSLENERYVTECRMWT